MAAVVTRGRTGAPMIRHRSSLWGFGRGERDPEIRFNKRISDGVAPDIRPELGPCLIFDGASNGNGYMQFAWNGNKSYAHRYAWERANGEIPAGLTIDHLCMNRRCVRLEHLEVVDGATNTKRGLAARKVCRKGHEYPPEQLATPDRVCKICRRDQWTRGESRRAKKRMRKADYIAQMRKTDPTELGDAVRRVLSHVSNPSEEARALGINPAVMERHVWKSAKFRTLLRDGNTCRRCSREGCDVHHRRARKSGGRKGNAGTKIAYGDANLVTLCRECHTWAEENPADAYTSGWRVHEWENPTTVPMVDVFGNRFLFDGTERVDL